MEPRPTPSQAVITIPEAARRLGLSAQSAYAAAACGEIPARKIGRRWIVPVAEFDRWLGGSATERNAPAGWPQAGDAAGQ